MNETTREEKLARFFSIVGFIVLVVLLAWLAVQFVRFLPTAFSSLANIFEDNQRELRENLDEEDNQPSVVVVDDEENNEDGIDWDADDEELTDEVANEDESDQETEYEDSEEVTTPVSTTPQYITVESYVVPQNDPNGYTDLEITLVAVGHMASNDRFVASNSLEEDERGAMQFKVKNIGTKTSNSWNFSALLPTGTVMQGKTQAPLGPSEIAIITVAFDTGSTGTKEIGATIYTNSDAAAYNNSFSSTVRINR